MRTVAISILLAAGAAFAAPAIAQTPPPPPAGDALFPASLMSYSPTSDPGWDGDAWRHPMGLERIHGDKMEIGVAALKASEFMLAEAMLADYLQLRPNSADANFYMGVAKMNLGEWDDARKHLEFAVQKKPKHPDPKSRLGVTYARLGDTAGANAQRAELVRMSAGCNGACKRELSPYIIGGIEMIDEALAEAPQG
jgi:Flp pilus assembly protein TadD